MAGSHHASEVDLQKIKTNSHCVSSLQVLVRMAVYIDLYFSTLFGMQTHFQKCTDVRGPSDSRAVTHSTFMMWPTG